MAHLDWVRGNSLCAICEVSLHGLIHFDPSGNTTFISSVILCLIFVLSAPVALIVSYFIAEEINVLANIAESLNNIETKLVDEEPPSDS